MFKKTILAVAAIATFSLTQIGIANAAPLGSLARQHNFNAKSLPPLQFQLFCLQNPQDCKANGPKEISYTPKIKGLVTSINAQVNRQIKPRNEKTDVWKIAVGNVEGDCDDYVMTKRHRLIKAGIPASALRIAVVRTPKGEGHAVLLVKTASGEYVLDNLRKTIVKKNQSGYRYISISSADPMRWSR